MVMSLIVGVVMLGVVAIVGVAGYLIDKSAER